MRRATVTIPPELETDLDTFIGAQPAPPSLASVVQLALRRMLRDPADSHTGELLARVLRNRQQIRALASSHGAQSIALFGSVARGEATAESDLDFMVTMEPGRTLFDLARLRGELEDLLGVDVDVVSTGGLDENVRAELSAEAISL